MEVYDPASDTWSTDTSLPTATSDLGAAVVNGHIYAVGGFAANSITGQLATATVEVYDPISKTWSTGSPLVTSASQPGAGLTGVAAVALKGMIYAIAASGSMVPSLTQVYDPASMTWSTSATSRPGTNSGGSGAGDVSAAVLNGKIYTLDGIGTVQVYDPGSNTWTTAQSLTPRGMPAISVANGSVYALGAQVNGIAYISLTEVYAPSVTVYTFIRN